MYKAALPTFAVHTLWSAWQAEAAAAGLAEDLRDAGALYAKYMTKALAKVRPVGGKGGRIGNKGLRLYPTFLNAFRNEEMLH